MTASHHSSGYLKIVRANLLLGLVRVHSTQAAPFMEPTGILTIWVPASADAKSGDLNRLHFVQQQVNSSTRAHVSVKHAESALLRARTITRNGAAAARKMPTTSAFIPWANTPCQTL
jgi:hypothetical protein